VRDGVRPFILRVILGARVNQPERCGGQSGGSSAIDLR
jgi:hypothetical protein